MGKFDPERLLSGWNERIQELKEKHKQIAKDQIRW